MATTVFETVPSVMSRQRAARYLGISAKTFDRRWKPYLPVIDDGGRPKYARSDIDALAEARRKVPSLRKSA